MGQEGLPNSIVVLILGIILGVMALIGVLLALLLNV